MRCVDSSSFHTDQFKVQTTHPATRESLQSLASTLSQGSRPLPIKLLPLPSSSSVVRTALARKMQALSPQDQYHCWSKWLFLGAMVILCLCHPSWLIIRNPVSSQPVATPIPMIHHLCQPKKRQERPAADVEQNGRSSRPGREAEISKTFIYYLFPQNSLQPDLQWHLHTNHPNSWLRHSARCRDLQEDSTERLFFAVWNRAFLNFFIWFPFCSAIFVDMTSPFELSQSGSSK